MDVAGCSGYLGVAGGCVDWQGDAENSDDLSVAGNRFVGCVKVDFGCAGVWEVDEGFLCQVEVD